MVRKSMLGALAALAALSAAGCKNRGPGITLQIDEPAGARLFLGSEAIRIPAKIKAAPGEYKLLIVLADGTKLSGLATVNSVSAPWTKMPVRVPSKDLTEALQAAREGKLVSFAVTEPPPVTSGALQQAAANPGQPVTIEGAGPEIVRFQFIPTTPKEK